MTQYRGGCVNHLEGAKDGNRARYLLACALSGGLLAVVSSVSATAAVAPGSLDQTFGNGGKVLTDLGVGGGVASDAVLQSNGDIVVSGGFGAARYLPSGQLDQTFGLGGLASTGIAGDGDSGTAVAVQSDGKFIWVGSQSNPDFTSGGTFEFAVARFNPNGSLDTSFGSGGKVLSSTLGGITTLGLDAAGDIFTLPTLAEFSPSGQADAAVTPAAITASSHGGTSAFLPSGQFVQANSVGVAKHDDDIQVQRFNAGGSIASTSAAFDYSGATGLDQARDSAGAVALQANGQAVTGGSHFLGSSVFGLARTNPDGTLDASFGSGGILTTTFNGDEGVGAVVIQPDGKIIAVGFSENNSTGHVFIALARYNG